MNQLKNIFLIFVFLGTITSCKNSNQAEETPIYFVQLFAEKDSKYARSIGQEFGEMKELKNEFITNDSTAYIWAWKLAESIRNQSTDETKDIFSAVNEFKLYNESRIEITNSVSFDGIENYPNPIK